MTLDFVRIETLPRLAWCAELSRGRGSIRVIHGPWVETGKESFLEGAWDGPYADGAFDRAVTLVGSGGKLTPDGVRFCAPSHNLERLYAVRSESDLWVSNSLVFVLVRSGQSLDLEHPDYYFDLIRYYRAGLRLERKTLRTASGRRVSLFEGVDIFVDPDLSIERLRKDYGPEPGSFLEYEHFLQGTVVRVIENAGAPGRTRTYPPLTSISRGYDSAAVSALAADAGCIEAVTFLRSNNRDGGYSPDDGTEIAACLGLNVTPYERFDERERADFSPAEMFVDVYRATETHNRVMASQTAGTLWLNGRHGEQFWNLDPLASRPWLEDPVSTSAAGTNHAEARLRIGYLSFPVPYTLGVYAPAINRISRSKDMRPWRIGGWYDRPIARRILETRDVPRDLFGHAKMGGGGRTASELALPRRWEEDFLAFYHEQVPEATRARMVEQQVGEVPYYRSVKMGSKERWLRAQPLLGGISNRVLGTRTHHRRRSRYLYTFHWGLERIRERYEVELD